MPEDPFPSPSPAQASGTRTHPEAAPAPSKARAAGHYWQYCVTCGTLLEGRKCKLICPRCGFYHSCSEP